MSEFRWATKDYSDRFFVGSEGENGEHRRQADGWPYSVYRMAEAIGRTDVVVCHGIQSLDDAKEICDRLQGLA
jgi:hypothetical protein